MISACSSLNTNTLIGSKNKNSLSATKARIPQILPSKFKLCPATDEVQEGRPEAAGRSGAPSENGDLVDVMEEKNGPFNGGARTTPEFSTLYRNMHNIERPRSLGFGANASVRGLASTFEKSGHDVDRGRAIPCHTPRHAVSCRVMEFEQIIQSSSGTAPKRSASMPTLYTGTPQSPEAKSLQSALSAESLMSLQKDEQSLKETCLSQEIQQCSSGTLQKDSRHHTDHTHHLHHEHAHQLHLRASKCKGSCPASYTRFTTILRHERQQASLPERRSRIPLPPAQLLLTAPVPFTLQKKLHPKMTRHAEVLSTRPGPIIPQRLSSLEVLERLGNGEDTDDRNTGEGGGGALLIFRLHVATPFFFSLHLTGVQCVVSWCDLEIQLHI